MIEFKLWDTKFKIEDDILYRINKLSKKWVNCMKIKPNSYGYIQLTLTNDKKIRREFRLHRLVYYGYNQDWNIMDSTKNNVIDHIDRCPLNNNISNLRIVTQKQNGQNSNSIGYCYDKKKRKYGVTIYIDESRTFLGFYSLKSDARLMYLIGKNMIYKTLLPFEIEEMNKLRNETKLDIDKLVDKYITNHYKPKFKGYSLDKRRNRYGVKIMKDKVEFSLASYKNKDDARLIYLIFKNILNKLDDFETKEMIELKENRDLKYEDITKKYREKYNI